MAPAGGLAHGRPVSVFTTSHPGERSLPAALGVKVLWDTGAHLRAPSRDWTGKGGKGPAFMPSPVPAWPIGPTMATQKAVQELCSTLLAVRP